jgi:hypothetical protein
MLLALGCRFESAPASSATQASSEPHADGVFLVVRKDLIDSR